ncbi:galactoside 2-alpha-L-fucosyltransferase-like [Typha angustifolia]|uniref:galactoside 2-alpha-L-fucosyltransferase-like n=1 Tax=Typha angustifolia TaxID=59011 RepID=UPI003C2E93E8
MDVERDGGGETKKAAKWRQAIRPEVVLSGFLMSLLLLVYVYANGRSSFTLQGTRNSPSATSTSPQDELLGGLLSPGFDEQSCESRYKSSLYRKKLPFSPSSYLIERLRKYESYHKKCSPKTTLYSNAVEQLKSGNNNTVDMGCKYLVWLPFNGLGNRMLSLASAFLYALLTNRVLLIHDTDESEGLFCEPFPGSSWLLPSDFPVKNFENFDWGSPKSYVNMLKSKVIGKNENSSSQMLPEYVYLDLVSAMLRSETNIFCEEHQLVLEKFNWMILKSDVYFIPPLFLMQIYRDELHRLFPIKESVFHHLGRYLFHPANQVWGIITRYYEAYLSRADEVLGLQIRIFDEAPISFDDMYEQIVTCSQNEKLLPETANPTKISNSPLNVTKVKAVLVTSLYSGYYEKMKAMYYEKPTTTGEVVAIYQPSHEEQQHTEANMHNQKALAEMYLLSYSDEIITSGYSTFGYIAHGLGGLRPWILMRPGWMQRIASPPCVRAMSVEPCLHSPPRFDCRAKEGVDLGTLVPYVRLCEDVSHGLKLFN